MNSSRRRLGPRPVAALALVVMGAVVLPAAALDPCETPAAQPGGDVYTTNGATFYAGGTKATIAWDAGTSGGFLVEWSTSKARNSDGSFATRVGKTDTLSSAREAVARSLEERTYYYHVQAKPKSGVCGRSGWSNIVEITQDATPPQVAFTTKAKPLSPTPITPPVPTYVSPDYIRLEGRAHDPIPPTTSASSGTHFVVLTLQNSTPVVGGSEPMERTVFVDTDGTWLADFADVPAGLYTAAAVGIDLAQNQAEDAATLTILVLDT